MATKQIIPTFLIALLTLFFQTACGQYLDTIKLDNRQSILNDRAFFDFPTYATNIKRGVDIMSADPNENEETRIVLDMGEMRLVFFAQEIFTIADNDFIASLDEQNKKDSLKTKILTEEEDLLSVLSTPGLFDSSANAILVNSLFVRAPDNTLFKINAYINPAAYKLRYQFVDLTEKVFKTLSKGTRLNNLLARQEKHAIFGTDMAFTFDLPANYAITVDQQYDFQVFKFHRYQTYSDTNWVQMLVYVGYHPSLVYDDYGLSRDDAQKVRGTFLDKKIEWLYFDRSKAGFYDKEQLVSFDQISEELNLHLVMLSNEEKSIEELTRIMESVQLIGN